MRDTNDISSGQCSQLERPILRGAYQWVSRRLDRRGLLDRPHVSAPALANFIRHVSLFYLELSDDGEVIDYHARVLASHIADNLSEISGKSGKESLPQPLFERWRTTAQVLVDEQRAFRTRTTVYGKHHKQGESLVVPVTEHGILNHALVFTEYWIPDQVTREPAVAAL